MNIKLSKKHGLAPALTFCRICGKETNELALLGSKADRVMREVYEASNGQVGSKNGYQEYGYNRIPASEPCDECKSTLSGGGIIFVAQDTEEYLKLTKEQCDSLVGRIGDGERVMDIDALRGKVVNLRKAFWYQDDEDNLRLRDPKEWVV